jgi:hypothetical protein
MADEKRITGRLTLDELKLMMGYQLPDSNLKAFEGHALVKVYRLENAVHANFVETMLKEEGIPFFIRTYKDTAYDGIFTASNGWGEVITREEDSEKAGQLIKDVLESRFDAPELDEDDK